ncbi:hypothetical protein BDV96DRAFT_625322 [Lophiotrema nucula]|uniref:GST N-terminal domain-containing protein n=1 Tax=Lophiotrema nucula TaxID=690887 RepID=A0A6A5YKW3_9PLEO|nr:hypothetical protein BDV96DRAFT_625322 [Lophiotrema nucula]
MLSFYQHEFGIPYDLKIHTREPVLSPQTLQSVPGNKTGKAPFVSDTEPHVLLCESGAICQYILEKYGKGSPTLAPKYGDKNYADYPVMINSMFINMSKAPDDDEVKAWSKQRLDAVFQHLDDRLKDNKWLVGEQPAYQRAMQKGDPEMDLLLGAEPPKKSIIKASSAPSNF